MSRIYIDKKVEPTTEIAYDGHHGEEYITNCAEENCVSICDDGGATTHIHKYDIKKLRDCLDRAIELGWCDDK